MVAGGGSVGHLAPLVAVSQAMRAAEPATEVLAICSERAEDGAYLASEGLTWIAIPRPRRDVRLPFTFLAGWRRARQAMEEWKPDVLFSKGGAVSVPVCLAAWWHGVPVVLHESDAVMGWANALVSRIATTVCLGLPGAGNGEVTGNPVRLSATGGNRAEGLRLAELQGDRPVLLVVGGSQGAESINRAVTEQLSDLLAVCDVIHITGHGKTAAEPRPGYKSFAFVGEELRHLYACSTLAVSRAGAGSISELAANRLPAILVPIEGLAHNHQLRNAEAAAACGGFVVARQATLGIALLPTVQRLLSADRTAMAEAAARFHRPAAAADIAERVRAAVKVGTGLR